MVSDKKMGCRALFDLTQIKESFRSVLKERPNHKRAFLLLMILIFEIEILVIVSSHYTYKDISEKIGLSLRKPGRS